MIVMKFGGSSVENADGIEQVISIVRSRLDRQPVVVVSAMARVTDALLVLGREASQGKMGAAGDILKELRERHVATARILLEEKNPARSAGGYFSMVEREIDACCSRLQDIAAATAVLGEVSLRSQDAMVSHGELLSSRILWAAFRDRGIEANWADSRQFIITDDRFTCASPLVDETSRCSRQALLPMLELGRVPVAQGFIGCSPAGATTTLGRNGSDYTATLIGAALEAEAIEIWTDADGLMTADPRLAPGARSITSLSYDEAAELAHFGARVLHPHTLSPIRDKQIPVHIYNTRNPISRGTVIAAQPPAGNEKHLSVTLKRGMTLATFRSTAKRNSIGFLRAVFEAFDRNCLAAGLVCASESRVSIAIESATSLEGILRELEGIAEADITNHKAIVCVIGNALTQAPGTQARLLQSIERATVHMISQPALAVNLAAVVDDSDAEGAVRSLHRGILAELDNHDAQDNVAAP